MPVKRNEKPILERKTALCYIRQSFTRDADDTNSPERQRANILGVCERNGWTPEWYEDVGGHKSGRYEKNRPQWLSLKSRLGDPDIVALVANDLSRLHRKGWRVGDLIDYLNEYNVNLVLAAPGREVDTTTMKGRMFLQFGAIIDEYYAEDISQRAKDNIAYRKAQGKSIGIPPFGTIRGENGYLKPTPHGAWLLTNGTFVAGNADTPPEDGAKWRGYYDAAEFILSLYAEGQCGLEKLAYTFNDEGWAFRDRLGVPRPIERDDIRRVVSNWPEYGGIIMDKSGKDRPAYEKYDVQELPFNADRAVFPLVLLKAVAEARQYRSVRPIDQSVKRNAFHYALSGIVYCMHCEERATKHENLKLRSALSGNTTIDGIHRYRHKLGVKCGCTNRSVPCDVLEQDFTRLIKLLTVRPTSLNLMTELAIQADKARGIDKISPADLEKEKQEAIALCRKRIDATINLYGDGRISREEYLRRVESNERDIAHWEARTSETEKMAFEFAMCVEAIDKISRLWDMSDEEDRQGLVRSLFTQITYDLDRQRIVDFRLKPWADRFLTLRASLYELEEIDNGTDDGNTPNTPSTPEGMACTEGPYGAQIARLIEMGVFVSRVATITGFFALIESGTQNYISLSPSLELEIHNTLSVQIIHNVIK